MHVRSRVSTGSRQSSLPRVHVSDYVFYGWGSKRTVVVSVSGNSHTDDVAFTKNKEVSDRAVSRFLSTGRRCLQFARTMLFGMYVVFGTYTIIMCTNPIYQVPGNSLISSLRYKDKNDCCCCILGTKTAGSSGAVVAVHV